MLSAANLREGMLVGLHEVEMYMYQNTAHILRLCHQYVSFGYVLHQYLIAVLENYTDTLPIPMLSAANLREGMSVALHEVEM